MRQTLTIYHLYPDDMNLYGDLGNIITLQKRCEWRGIGTEVVNVNAGHEADFSKADIIFMGGGQNSGQNIISQDLANRGPAIKNEIEQGLPALLICGGFQLFGHYFQTCEGERITGISIFDAYTIAGHKRFSGNLIVDISSFAPTPQSLVGFENHSGLTILGTGAKPFGRVVRGYGNTGNGLYEGAVYKNAIGTYLHGSLLPKNPWLADHLIFTALLRRYGPSGPLLPLDDKLELIAHRAAKKRSLR